MYCPQCKSEYREGFTTCAECQIPLIEGLPPDEEEIEEEDSGVKILLETTHPTSLDPLIIQLEERGIPYIVQSGTALSMLEGRMVAPLPEDWRAVVLVPSENFATAQSIMAEIKTEPTEENEPG
ncbi:hypothetical protein L0222_10125 [bacterium]|nr:hypothetical protein [bacterium]MCI0604621.1 hypothetical protein [bacterium]